MCVEGNKAVRRDMASNNSRTRAITFFCMCVRARACIHKLNFSFTGFTLKAYVHTTTTCGSLY